MTLHTIVPKQVSLYHDDCRRALKALPDNSIDSVVTDPPYALVSIVKRFGGKDAAAAKHGTDGLYARASAGFMGKQWDTGETAFAVKFWAEVYRVLKPGGHVLAFSGTRTQHRLVCAVEDAGFEIRDQIGWLYGTGFPKNHAVKEGVFVGWGTALKPAWEPICVARKPLEGTVAANVIKHGTGAINIDGCRLPPSGGHARIGEASQDRRYSDKGSTAFTLTPGPRGGDPAGRFPANVIHVGSDEVVAAFPTTAKSGTSGVPSARKRTDHGLPITGDRSLVNYGDEGSAARFFYSAKASKRDRGGSKHPTVKPIALMRYLCRLVTPPGGIVLDPFAGSGTTLVAAMEEGFRVVGCEREDEYVEDIKRRFRAHEPTNDDVEEKAA